MSNVVIPITQYCPICEKEQSMPSGYVPLKDAGVLCFTCKQCYVAQLHILDKGEEGAEMTKEEYLTKLGYEDFDRESYLVQKEGLQDSNGNPINNLKLRADKNLPSTDTTNE